MMRRFLTYMLAAFAAIVVPSGCTDKSYGGFEEEEILDDTTEPIPVKVHVGSSGSIIPKGSGVMGESQEWRGAKFYVYAFNRDMFSTFDVTSKTNSSLCLIDGSKDVPGSLAGKEAYMSETSTIVAWAGPDEKVYYPFGSESGTIYDFFAYYVDDIVIEPKDISRKENRIVMQVEIDGTQDLMSSKARVLADQLAGFEDEQERLYMENYCYSYYAARKGIDPVFIFKHHLTKVDFILTPAYNSTGKRKVSVRKIEVRSPYKAMFTVADKANADNLGVVFDDNDLMNLPVREKGGVPMPEDRYVIETLDSPTSAKTPVRIGTSLLVAPADGYEAYIYMDETWEDGTVKIYEEPQRIVLSNAEGFLPGNGYTVNISLYGATRMDVGVTLTKWNDGGRIEIDDEDAFGNY